MKSFEMMQHTPYVVTKGSTDGTLDVGDIVWLSTNDDLNIASHSGSGWLDREEWTSDSETHDFEVEESKDYKVILMRGSEYLVSNRSLV